MQRKWNEENNLFQKDNLLPLYFYPEKKKKKKETSIDFSI